MQRAILTTSGIACLFLAVLFAEYPIASAPAPMPGSPIPVAQLDQGTVASVDSHRPPVASSPAQEKKTAADKGAWLNLLTELEFTPFDQATPQILEALRSPEREVRLRAVNLLVAAKDKPAMLPLLAVAQADADAEVRRDAVIALANSPLKENLTPYLLRAASDMNADVRDALIQTAWSLAPAQRDELIAQSLNSSRTEVASAAFDMLAQENSTETIRLLLNVYATNNADRIRQANDVMRGLLNQTFDNAATASGWWHDHQAEYNDDLSPRTDDTAASL